MSHQPLDRVTGPGPEVMARPPGRLLRGAFAASGAEPLSASPLGVNPDHFTVRWAARSRTTDTPGLRACGGRSQIVERVTGIEPALSAWEAEVLPLNYTRAAWRRPPMIATAVGASASSLSTAT